jgi:DHA1 family quinolone resistance protein-like MFS transporter
MQKIPVPLRKYFLLDVNPVIRYLILSDLVLGSAWGLFAPISAIFFVDYIEGGDVAVAGIATTVFLITKSVLQVPIADFLDRIKGESDDFWVMFVGSLVMALIPLLYLVIATPFQLYLVQFVLGFFTAATFPSYMGIFTRHIDKDREGTDWGLYFTLTDLGSALAAAIGGAAALLVGFRALLVVVVVVSFLGALFLFPLRYHIQKK